MENEGKQLKRIDFSKGEFTANGKRYVIEDQFAISRWVMKEEFEMQIGYKANFSEMQASWEECYNLANQQRFADIAVLAYNNVRGILKVKEREPLILQYCALFCNAQGEDRTVITEDMISEKIKDWQEEGIAIGDFFTLAVNTIPDYIASYKRATEKYSPNVNKK